MIAPRTIAFVDGSNLFCRLRDARLKMDASLKEVLSAVGGSDRVPTKFRRIYVYSTQPQFDEAVRVHGERFLRDCRLEYGEAVESRDGIKEKGVDAILVADLVYHAAAKNLDNAVLVSHDTDFCRPLRRVEDFGARTVLIALCQHAPPRLRASCDKYVHLDTKQLVERGWAKLLPGSA